jgi:hypothetical protein
MVLKTFPTLQEKKTRRMTRQANDENQQRQRFTETINTNAKNRAVFHNELTFRIEKKS